VLTAVVCDGTAVVVTKGVVVVATVEEVVVEEVVVVVATVGEVVVEVAAELDVVEAMLVMETPVAGAVLAAEACSEATVKPPAKHSATN